jgi:hypothetical protein|tara:strand:- start:1490 stop:1687 length:198 start_codon:yes stop_codon:yes gene_type:complete
MAEDLKSLFKRFKVKNEDELRKLFKRIGKEHLLDPPNKNGPTRQQLRSTFETQGMGAFIKALGKN